MADVRAREEGRGELPEAERSTNGGPSADAALRIGSWRFEPRTGDLSREDESLRLKPQQAALLDLLARRPGEVFSLDELVDGIWDGRAVSDSAVWRAVADLRRALGDDPQEPTYIETLPRRGYRLIASVDLLEEEGGGAILPALAERAGPTSSEGRFRWRYAVMAAGVALAVAGVLGSHLFVRAPEPEEKLSPDPAETLPPSERRSVLMAIENATDDPNLVEASEVAAEISWSRIPGFQIVRSDQLRAALRRIGSSEEELDREAAWEVCRREGFDLLFGLAIRATPRGLAVEADVRATSTGESILRETVAVDGPAELPRIVASLVERAHRGVVGRELPPAASLEPVSAPSFEALVDFSAANSELDRGNYEEALELFRELVREHPDFAHARLGYVVAQVALGQYEPGPVEDALEHSTGLPLVEHLYLDAWNATLRMQPEALAKWAAMARSFPEEERAWANLGLTQLRWRDDFHRAAEALRRSRSSRREVRPNQVWAEAMSLASIGEAEAAVELIRELQASHPDSRFKTAAILQAVGRVEEALEEVAATPIPIEDEPQLLVLPYLLPIERGDLRAAYREISQRAEFEESESVVATLVGWKACLAARLGTSGESFDAEMRTLGEWARRHRLDQPMIGPSSPIVDRARAGLVAVRVGDVETGESLLEVLQGDVPRPRVAVERSWTTVLEAELALARGDRDGAADLFRRARLDGDSIAARLGLLRAFGETGSTEVSRLVQEVHRDRARLFWGSYDPALICLLLDWRDAVDGHGLRVG